MKIEVVCDNCGISFLKYFGKKGKPSKRNYCCMDCKKSDKNSYVSEWSEERRLNQSMKFSGENNPNFGNKWSEEQKQYLSNVKIQQYKDNPELAYECGKSNRGKTRLEISKLKQSESVMGANNHFFGKTHTEESKLLIGMKSSEKFTDEYKQNRRVVMEKLGYWVPILSQDPYKIYYKQSDWVGNVLDYLPEQQKQLLNEFGVWNNKTNKNGLVRDHILSRKEGWLLNVDYKIMRHPCNLELLSHSINITKGFIDRKLSENVSKQKLYTLLYKIIQFDGDWQEHKQVLDIIRNNYEL